MSSQYGTVVVPTAVGNLHVVAREGFVCRIHWTARACDLIRPQILAYPLELAVSELRLYSEGALKRFSVPIRPKGSPFQLSVWQEMRRIPYGETRTYGELAAVLRSNARAVGRSCGANPIPIVVPCHRVVGQNGKLTGFSGGEGLETKRQLLSLEQRSLAHSYSQLPIFASLAQERQPVD